MFPDLEIVPPSIGRNVEQQLDFSSFCDFSEAELPNYFKTLRQPLAEMTEKISLSERPGYLRLYGEQSITSLHRQTLVARRWQHVSFSVETEMEFDPENFQQMAGLVLFYDTDNWHYLQVSYDENLQSKVIQVESNSISHFSYRSERIEISSNRPIHLSVEVERNGAQFYYRVADEEKQVIGEVVEADHLSDDFIKANGKLAFTGAMVGICAQDLYDHRSFADFNFFNYVEKHLEE
nr:hypothetical protein [Vagococcus allomyrinae]